MKTCLKCGYTRRPDDSAPEYACPKCGRVYAKVEQQMQKEAIASKPLAQGKDLDTQIEVRTSAETRCIDELVDEAQKYYPHQNTTKALALFRRAIQLASPALASKTVQEARDHSAIGDAFWMAWVCLDILERPPAETEALLVEARVKSPVTAARIEECLAQAKETDARKEQSEEAFATLENADGQDPARVQIAMSTLTATGAWWLLRDAGIALTKKGKYDLAWQALNSALSIALNKPGNVPSIYSAMGDLWKARQSHGDAARYYLLSCLSAGDAPLKRALDQLRISLKKAGASGDPAAIRNELLAMRTKCDESTVLARLDSFILKV